MWIFFAKRGITPYMWVRGEIVTEGCAKRRSNPRRFIHRPPVENGGKITHLIHSPIRLEGQFFANRLYRRVPMRTPRYGGAVFNVLAGKAS